MKTNGIRQIFEQPTAAGEVAPAPAAPLPALPVPPPGFAAPRLRDAAIAQRQIGTSPTGSPPA